MSSTVNTITGSCNGSSDINIFTHEYLASSIIIPTHSALPVALTVNPVNKMDGIAEIIFSRDDNLDVSINPRIQSFIPASVSVSPSGSMEVLTDVEQLPLVMFEFPVTRDAVILSNNPTLNYGYEEEVLIGAVGVNEYRTILNFHLFDLPWNNPDFKYVNAELCLNNINKPNLSAELYSVDSDWDEYGITWRNQPSLKTKIKDIIIGEKEGVQTVDLTTYLEDWDGDASFVLTPAEGSIISRIKAKEAEQDVPTIKLYFKQNVIHSLGRHNLQSNITVRHSNKVDLPCEIIVDSHNVVDNLPTSIIVPLCNENNYIPCSITVSQKRAEDILSVITVPSYTGDLSLAANINIREREYLPCSIKVAQYDCETDLPCEIGIPSYTDEYNFMSTITVTCSSTIPCSISIDRYAAITDLLAEITPVLQSAIPATITIPKYDGDCDMLASISTPYKPESYLACTIDVPSYNCDSDIPASIEPRLHAYIPCSISARVSDTADLNTSITARVKQINDLQITADIYQHSSLPVIINVRQHSDLIVNITIKSKLKENYAFVM